MHFLEYMYSTDQTFQMKREEIDFKYEHIYYIGRSTAKEADVTIHLDTNFPVEVLEKGRDIKDRVVGIHLGTTHSSVAVLRYPGPPNTKCHRWEKQCSEPSKSDLFELVLNEHGSRTTPSCVAFTDSGVLIGESAKDQAPDNPERTVCGIISLVGKRFDDPDVQSYIKTLPYKVVNKENKPHVEVKYENGETKVFSPEEISAMLLGKMKEIAEAYMGDKIEYAVVYLRDSYFNKETHQIMRSSIEEAGKMVGLVVGYVSDSRDATILTGTFGDRRVLIYNLGGRAFDVSVQENSQLTHGRLQENSQLTHGRFEVVAFRGDEHLGGQAFDMRVVDYFVNLIKSKYNRDISQDTKALRKLEIECEKAKISLSSKDRVMIKIESLADGIGLFEEPLTRETFEELNMDLFNKTIDLLRSVLNEGSEIEKRRKIDHIIVVGGNSQIPKIQHMLKEELGRESLKDVSPDEAMAFAATQMAREFSDTDESLYYDVLTYDFFGVFIMPYAKNVMDGLLPSHSSEHIRYYLSPGETRVTVDVVEGTKPMTKDCRTLGRFEVDYPPSTSKEQRQVDIIVHMGVDVDANVLITAMHKGSLKIITMMSIPAEKILHHRKHLQGIFRGRNVSREEHVFSD